jgi:glycosyltransferase involved in cell wall biosynthesis
MLRLKELGFSVHFIAPQTLFATKLVKMGFEYHYLPLQPYSMNVLKELKLVRHLYRIYKEEEIAMAFHYTAKLNIYGSFAAGRLGIPSIAMQTGLGELPLLEPGLKRFLVHQLYRTALYSASEIWFLNHKDRNYFLKNHLAPVHKMKCIPGEGVDLQYYLPREVERDDDEVRFLFLGRLLKTKGIPEFISAARRIRHQYPSARFLIVGIFNLDHPRSIDTEELYRWQKEGIIEFLGERMDVRPVLASCDCLVHPSYYNEGLSRVLMEAAAMELPIITTDQVGCRELVRDGYSGFVVPKRNVDALVDAIEEIIHMSQVDRMVLGKNGRRHVENNFGEEKIVGEYRKTVNNYLVFKSDYHLPKADFMSSKKILNS